MFVFACLPLLWTKSAHAQLREYDTKYYIIHTDIDPEEEQEAAIRMTKMAEEYHQRTSGFAGVIREKFPFYLYRNSAEYFAAGGLPGSAGMFMSIGRGGKLMAIAGRHTTQSTWHTVQHEGFHQFAHAVIGGEMPTWLNEGLAEYFGESIFTGDGFVTGVIPPWRLSRLKQEIAGARLKSMREIMDISAQKWADEMKIQNYDQAWAMVHFLVHGEDQKYQPGFSDCIRAMANGGLFDEAWNSSLPPVDLFEQRWKTWWTALPERPTTVLYGKAAVATMTSFVARAYASKQTFSDFAAFRSAVDKDQLKINPDDWLPRSLIVNAFRVYGDGLHWELITSADKSTSRFPKVALTLEDSTRLVGSFTLSGNRVDKVTVEIDNMAEILKDAQSLADAGHKEKARVMVQSAIRDIPSSSMIADAKKFLQSLR
jgi:hypothetical protein